MLAWNFVEVLLRHLSVCIYKYKPYAYLETLNNKTLMVINTDNTQWNYQLKLLSKRMIKCKDLEKTPQKTNSRGKQTNQETTNCCTLSYQVWDELVTFLSHSFTFFFFWFLECKVNYCVIFGWQGSYCYYLYSNR